MLDRVINIFPSKTLLVTYSPHITHSPTITHPLNISHSPYITHPPNEGWSNSASRNDPTGEESHFVFGEVGGFRFADGLPDDGQVDRHFVKAFVDAGVGQSNLFDHQSVNVPSPDKRVLLRVC